MWRQDEGKGGGSEGGDRVSADSISCPLPTQHHVQIATCVQPHGETPVAFTRAIASDTLEHFGTLEAMAGWNFLEHLKLRGLNLLFN